MFDKIAYTLYIVLIASCLVSSILNRKLLGRFALFFSVLLGITLVFESLTYVIDMEYKNLLNHLYQPLEFTLMILIYQRVIIYSWFKKLVLPTILVFWSVSIGLSAGVEGLYEPNTLSFLIGSVLIIGLATIYHIQLLTTPGKETSIFRVPFFWINTGNLFFFLGTFFQMGLNTYLQDRAPDIAHELILINIAMNLILYTLYLIGTLCHTSSRSS